MTEDVIQWARERFRGVCIIHRAPMVQVRSIVSIRAENGEEYEQIIEIWACPHCRHLDSDQAQSGSNDFRSAKSRE